MAFNSLRHCFASCFKKHLPHHFVVRVHHTLHEFFWVSVCFFPVFRHLSHHFLGVTHHFLHHHAWIHRTIFILAISSHLLHHFL